MEEVKRVIQSRASINSHLHSLASPPNSTARAVSHTDRHPVCGLLLNWDESLFSESKRNKRHRQRLKARENMSIKFPCARCQRNTEWIGNFTAGGTSRCTQCDILSTSSMLPCPGCERVGFLYPTRCSTCSQLPAEVFLIIPGSTLTFNNGTSVTGAKTGNGVAMVIGDHIYMGGSLGDLNISGHVTIGIP
jgi:hypothetical protein